MTLNHFVIRLVARARRPLLDNHRAPPRARVVGPPRDARVARPRRPAVAVVMVVSAVVVVMMRPSHGDDFLVVVVLVAAIETEAHLECLLVKKGR